MSGKKYDNVIKKVSLEIDQLSRSYQYINRIPKKQENEGICQVWNLYLENKEESLEPIQKYINEQKVRMERNLSIEFYDGNEVEYKEVLKTVEGVLRNPTEVFIRDFSIRLFHDSKRVEQLKSKVQTFLYQYGDFEDKDYVLEECGIVNTPTYVMIKGNGKISIAGQDLNLSKITGDIALSTTTIQNLDSIQVLGKRVITIENLTSFHDYNICEDFAIYLGGFHNRVKRQFIQYVYEQNKDKQYLHFGDIDAGGFYILIHLRRKTKIDFTPIYMNTEMLIKYAKYTKKLTANDRKRLNQLITLLSQQMVSTEAEKLSKTIRYMLEHDCKLEQEAINVNNI